MMKLTPRSEEAPAVSYTPGAIGSARRDLREALPLISDQDGVFNTTEAVRYLLNRGYKSGTAHATVFYWSDPTDMIGYRSYRTKSPRGSADTPAERFVKLTQRKVVPMPEKKEVAASEPAQPEVPRYQTGMPVTNKKGKFYSDGSERGPFGSRELVIERELLKLVDKYKIRGGWFSTSKVIHELADMGFSAGSTYSILRRISERNVKGSARIVRSLTDWRRQNLSVDMLARMNLTPLPDRFDGELTAVDAKPGINLPKPEVKATGVVTPEPVLTKEQEAEIDVMRRLTEDAMRDKQAEMQLLHRAEQRAEEKARSVLTAMMPKIADMIADHSGTSVEAAEARINANLQREIRRLSLNKDWIVGAAGLAVVALVILGAVWMGASLA